MLCSLILTTRVEEEYQMDCMRLEVAIILLSFQLWTGLKIQHVRHALKEVSWVTNSECNCKL